MSRWAGIVCLGALSALAAGRPLAGGTLGVALTSPLPPNDPLLVSHAADAALLPLLASPLCREEKTGVVPVLAKSLVWSSPTTLEVKAWPGLLRADGFPLEPVHLARAWTRARTTPSPYRGLLSMLEGKMLETNGEVVTLRLTHPFPELERALCHPALAPASDARTEGVGPFRPQSSPLVFLANPFFPLGRPWADQLRWVPGDARAAERALAQRRVQLVLGTGSAAAPQLSRATYLQWRAAAVAPTFRAALESSLDRDELVRFFVRGPSAPLPGVVPGATGVAKPSAPAALTPARPLVVVVDAADDEHRALATRLQVKLHPLGYKVSVRAVARAELHRAWAAGDGDAFLLGVWLPAQPAAALAVALEVAQPGASHPDLAALPVGPERDAATVSLASSLGEKLPVMPLVLQGLALRLGGTPSPLLVDAAGAPRLDELSLPAPE